MMKSRLLHGLVISLAVVSIAACSKKSPNGSDMMGGMGSGDQGAQTYGMSAQGGFADQGGVGGASNQRHVNAMTAPANQVYYFDFDQAGMQQSDLQAANIQANYLATHSSAHIRLEGNTDDRGSREYNVALGWRRAQAVAQVLEQQGVSPKQISMVSYGKEHPVAMGENEQAWSLNRRVELVYESQ